MPRKTPRAAPAPKPRSAIRDRCVLYFAYGSNLSVRSMDARCPDSIAVGKATLPDYRLTFRGVADVEPAPGENVHGALWLCPTSDERALDRYEGVAGGFYCKEYLPVVTEDGEVIKALVYIMCPTPLDNRSLPSQSYVTTIANGYRDFGLHMSMLDEAIERAYQRVVHHKGVRSFVPHGPKRMGPAGTARPVPPKPQTAKRKKRRDDAPGQKSPATTLLDALEQEERARTRANRRLANQAALETLDNPFAATTRSGRPLALRGERIA